MKKRINKQNNLIINNDPLKTQSLGNNKLQKKSKKLYLLVTTYLLLFAVTSLITLLLLFNNNVKVNDYNFNPDANNDIWNQYYHEREEKNQLIDLKDVVNNFSKKGTDPIQYSILKSGSVNYETILNGIDKNLQANNKESIYDKNESGKIPASFFNKVVYNPAVKMEIIDGKTTSPLTDFDFQPGSGYDQTKNYTLTFTTDNNDSEKFGIAKPLVGSTNNFNIQLHLKNEIAVNLKDITLKTLKQTIAVSDPTQTTVNDIKNILLPAIRKQFITLLAQKLNITDIKQISDRYYSIKFTNPDPIQPQDFSKKVLLTYNIEAVDTNPWNFFGKTIGTIEVQNTIVDLANQNDLAANIEAEFYESKSGKSISEIINGNNDTNLTDQDRKNISADIIKQVKPVVKNYFDTTFSQLKIDDKDYVIKPDLNGINNILNNKKGVTINLTIEASPTTFKLEKRLEKIAITIHGKNKDSISIKYQQDPAFKLDGIWVPSHQNDNILQNGPHYYNQDNLYSSWIGAKNSLLNNIKNNAYSVDENSFDGAINIESTLDEAKSSNHKVIKIKDFKNDKIANFYQLLTKTKAIFLKTVVISDSKKIDRTFDEEKLLFVNDSSKPDVPENILYELDLCVNPGCSIQQKATLVFNSFTFDITYSQKS